MQSAATQSGPAASMGTHVAPSLPIVAAPQPKEEADLLTSLLHEQQTLTAVEQFSCQQDDGPPLQSKHYAKLLPATPPREGEQYAFEVDLDRCSGCKACVTACHALNGLDHGETWRDVGLLIGGTSSSPVMQHVTTACHHCLEPGCMTACPVNAYEKDPVTGIVKHLDDQCFGCQYCTLACPYEVPQYNSDKGIVRKCDMCSGRLQAGEAPACVQACPHEAISIRVVNVQQVIEDAETDHFLPAAPDPQTTLPTTHFKTSRVFPRNTLPADYHTVSSQHPHWPLIVMLVLTQLSVGALTIGLVMENVLDPASLTAFRPLHATTALGFGLLAVAASTMHLGRPRYAFRAIIGLRHSWLSREIIAFGVFACVACLFAEFCWFHPDSSLRPVLGWSVVGTGAVGVFCSVMIYVVTGREYWSLGRTAFRFGMTSVVLGIAATWLSILVFGALFDEPAAARLSQRAGLPLVQALVVAAVGKLIIETAFLRHLASRRQSSLKRSARLIVGPLSGSTFARFACGLLGGIIMPAFLLSELLTEDSRDLLLTISVAMLFVACLVGELLERYQFFAACSAPRMPGSVGRV